MSDSLAEKKLFRGQIEELDGLRGIAILLVLFHHFWPREGALTAWAEVARLGWVGVDLFFVISGFLITGILLDTRSDPGYFRNFYWRRALRILPLYYAFLFGCFAVIPMAQGGPYFQSEFVREAGSPLWYLFYLGNLREAWTGLTPPHFLGPLWSLAIEEQFYVLFPLLVASLSREGLRKALIGLLLFAPLFRLATLGLFEANEKFQYVFTLSRVDVLALGGLLAIRVREPGVANHRSLARRWAWLLLAACAVAFALGGLDRVRPFCRILGYSLVGLTCLALVAWTVYARTEAGTGWLRLPGLRYLGRICYGIYLLHRPAEIAVLKVSGKLGLPWGPEPVVLMLLKVLAAVAVASLSWYLFESQFLRFKKAFASLHHPSSA